MLINYIELYKQRKILGKNLTFNNLAKSRSSLLNTTSSNWFHALMQSENGTTEINNYTALRITAVTKCLTVIGDGIAQMSLKLFEKTDSGRKEIPYPLTKDPNPYQTGYDFRKYLAVMAAYKGNGLAYIFRNPDYSPKSLLPITCEYTQKIVNGELYYVLSSEDLIQGLPREIHALDVLHFKGLCVDNYFNGISPIKAHAKALQLNLRSYTALDNTFKTGSKKFFLKGGDGKSWDTTQQKAVKDSIERLLNNESSTVAVPAGVDVESVSLTPAEAGYLEAIQASEHDIALMFNVPPSMVVRNSGAIKATVEQDALNFQNQTLLPLATQYEQELERKLIPENKKGSQYFKHNFNSLMRASASERMNFFTQGINNGIISPNEARRYEDMEAFEGGDIRYINAANIPVDQIEEWIAAKISNLNKTNMINNPEGENNNEQ